MEYSAHIVCLLIAVMGGDLITSAQDHDVRLSDIGGKQGRVEVLNNGVWGTVCREGWDFYDALVTCKQLGFSWLAYEGWKHDAGTGTGSVWLSNVGCLGSETSLEQCSNDGWMEHECTGQTGAAAVSCLDYNELGNVGYKVGFPLIIGGAVMSLSAEGNVVFNLDRTLRNESGSYTRFVISDQGWDMADAEVICRQSGYHSAVKALLHSYFGKYNPIQDKLHPNPEDITYLATQFACNGNESTLLQCPAKDWFEVDPPSEWRHAGVICNRIEEPEGFQIRLDNGTTAYEGRVEVFYNGTWGRICRRKYIDLSYRETNVICGQLGLGYGKEAPEDGRFGRSSLPVAMSGPVLCDGSELSIAQCAHIVWQDQSCASKDGSYDASVICSGPIPESRSPVRFPYVDSVGDVLIYHDGQWGNICNKGWTLANSQVVCRELGKGPPIQALMDPLEPYGPIFLGGGVSCKGDEATLDQCDLGEWSQEKANCDHSMDVAIHCNVLIAGSVSVQPFSFEMTLIVGSLTALHCMLQTKH